MRLNNIITRVPSQPQQPQRKYRDLKISNISTVTDATIPNGTMRKVDKRLTDKEAIIRALQFYDYEFIREVSNYFFVASGIYGRLCKYMAYMYRYDWFLTPYFPKHKNPKAIEMMAGNRELSAEEQKSVETFYQALDYLDRLEAKKKLQSIAVQIVKNGVYYGYLVDGKDRMMIQDLPIKYCRSRWNHLGKPTVEFNLTYFDTEFKSDEARKEVLNLFPDEFKKAYKKNYKHKNRRK